MKKILISMMAILFALPVSSFAYAEDLTTPGIELEEIIEEDVDKWLENVIEEEQKEVVVEEGYENLGPMVYKSSAVTAKIGHDKKGNYYIYYIMHGSPTALTVVEYKSKKIVHTFALEDSKGAWGLDIAEDGKLWIGGTASSVLYSYDPNTNAFEKHVNIFSNKSDTSVQDLVVAGENVYAGSAYGGTFASYNTITGEITDYGQVRKRREFVKAIEVDEKTNEIFMSIGSTMDLLKGDTNSKVFKSFLPPKYLSEKYAQDLILTDKYLLARLHPSNMTLVFDRKTLKVVDEFELNSKTLSALSPEGDAVYYTKSGQLMKYVFETQEQIELGLYMPKGTEAVTLDFVFKERNEVKEEVQKPKVPFDLNRVLKGEGLEVGATTEDKYPIVEKPNAEYSKDWVLTGMVDNLGQLFEYNPNTETMNYLQFELPEQPVELYTLASSQDGDKIFANGFMSGGLGIYDVATGDKELYRNISQTETMFDINNKLYIGAYPLARLLVYDRSLPWNPREIIRMSQYGQERTTAVTPYNGGKEIIFGTLPDTSVGGGALAFYDTITGNVEVLENFIYNQSISSLVTRGTEVFGGTSIHANQQVNPRGARLFYFNRSNPDVKKYIQLPFSASMITSLLVDQNNKVWGMADGKLFSYTDESTEVRTVELLPTISGRFRNAEIIDSGDGSIYGSVDGKLFRVTKDNLEVEWLKDSGVYGLVKDLNGDLYYYEGSNLWRYTIEKNREK